MTERPRALLIDLFYTLVSYSELPRWTMADRAKLLGVPMDAFLANWRSSSRSRYRGQLTLQRTMEQACLASTDGNPAAIPDIIEGLMERHRKVLMHPREDILNALKDLRGLGLRLGLISNIALEEASIFDESPLCPLFDTAILSCRVGLIKPEPEIFQIACKQLDVSPEACWFMGDGGSDELIGARKLGMKTVFVRGFIPPAEQEEHLAENPDFVVEHIPEVLALLNSTAV